MNQRLMAQSLIPSPEPEMVIYFPEAVYSGQFSEDGNFFFCCAKDFKVRMYDTANPYNWRHYKTAVHPFGAWALTDASLSPDNRWLVFSSIQPRVCLAPTDPNDKGDPLHARPLRRGPTGGGTGAGSRSSAARGMAPLRCQLRHLLGAFLGRWPRAGGGNQP